MPQLAYMYQAKEVFVPYRTLGKLTMLTQPDELTYAGEECAQLSSHDLPIKGHGKMVDNCPHC